MHYPVLFLPMFVVSLVTSVMSSDVLIGMLGVEFSLWINIFILSALSPPAIGITIILDRQICGESDLNFQRAAVTVLSSYILLLGVNLASWLIITVGLFLFIIPGIYLLVKLIMINQSLFLGEAETLNEILRESWKVSDGHVFEIFSLIMLIISPLLLLEIFFYEIPQGILATIQVTFGTALQTWLVISLTRFFLHRKERED